MEIGEQSDSESVEAFGPAPKQDVLTHDARTVWCYEQGVDAERGDTRACSKA